MPNTIEQDYLDYLISGDNSNVDPEFLRQRQKEIDEAQKLIDDDPNVIIRNLKQGTRIAARSGLEGLATTARAINYPFKKLSDMLPDSNRREGSVPPATFGEYIQESSKEYARKQFDEVNKISSASSLADAFKGTPRLGAAIRSTTSSIEQMFGLSALGIGSVGVIGGFSAMSGSSSYHEALDAGKTEEEAIKFGVTNAVIEGGITAAFQGLGNHFQGAAGFEGLTASRDALKKGIVEGFKRGGKETFYEVAEEESIFLMQALASYKAGVDPNQDFETTMRGMRDTLDATFLTMFATKGGVEGYNKGKKGFNFLADTKQSYEHQKAIDEIRDPNARQVEQDIKTATDLAKIDPDNASRRKVANAFNVKHKDLEKLNKEVGFDLGTVDGRRDAVLKARETLMKSEDIVHDDSKDTPGTMNVEADVEAAQKEADEIKKAVKDLGELAPDAQEAQGGINKAFDNLPEEQKIRPISSSIDALNKAKSDPVETLNELHKLKTRLDKWGKGVPDSGALRQEIEKSEKNLFDQGYESTDMVGTKYNDGLNVKPTFVVDENAEEGSEVITKTKTPAIFKDGVLVSPAEVEVTVGPNKTAPVDVQAQETPEAIPESDQVVEDAGTAIGAPIKHKDDAFTPEVQEKLNKASFDWESGDRPVSEQVVPSFPTQKVASNPDELQYKEENREEDGSTQSLKHVKNAKQFKRLAFGVPRAWYNEADDTVYIVDGHNRLAKAKELGIENIPLQFIKADSFAEARSQGALLNMMEGHGTVIDAAKFLRSSGQGLDFLVDEGVKLSDSVAGKGLALSKLHDDIFMRIINQNLSPNEGIIIAEAIPDTDKQLAFMRELDDDTAENGSVDQGVLKQWAEGFNSDETITETEMMLWGEETKTVSIERQKAEVKNDFIKALRKDKRVFGNTADNAKILEAAGNVLNTEENKNLADDAKAALNIFNTFKDMQGPLGDLIRETAIIKKKGTRNEKIAANKNFYEQAKALLPTLVQGRGKTGDTNIETGTSREPGLDGEIPAGPIDQGQVGLFDAPVETNPVETKPEKSKGKRVTKEVTEETFETRLQIPPDLILPQTLPKPKNITEARKALKEAKQKAKAALFSQDDIKSVETPEGTRLVVDENVTITVNQQTEAENNLQELIDIRKQNKSKGKRVTKEDQKVLEDLEAYDRQTEKDNIQKAKNKALLKKHKEIVFDENTLDETITTVDGKKYELHHIINEDGHPALVRQVDPKTGEMIAENPYLDEDAAKTFFEDLSNKGVIEDDAPAKPKKTKEKGHNGKLIPDPESETGEMWFQVDIGGTTVLIAPESPPATIKDAESAIQTLEDLKEKNRIEHPDLMTDDDSGNGEPISMQTYRDAQIAEAEFNKENLRVALGMVERNKDDAKPKKTGKLDDRAKVNKKREQAYDLSQKEKEAQERLELAEEAYSKDPSEANLKELSMALGARDTAKVYADREEGNATIHKIGDKEVITGHRAELVEIFTVDGEQVELWKGNNGSGMVRTVDTESKNVINAGTLYRHFQGAKNLLEEIKVSNELDILEADQKQDQADLDRLGQSDKIGVHKKLYALQNKMIERANKIIALEKLQKELVNAETKAETSQDSGTESPVVDTTKEIEKNVVSDIAEGMISEDQQKLKNEGLDPEAGVFYLPAGIPFSNPFKKKKDGTKPIDPNLTSQPLANNYPKQAEAMANSRVVPDYVRQTEKKAYWDQIKDSVSRVHEHLPNDDRFAPAREILRLHREVEVNAQREADKILKAILGPLRNNIDDKILFEHYVMMSNIVESLEAGELASYQIESVEQAREMLAELQEQVDAQGKKKIEELEAKKKEALNTPETATDENGKRFSKLWNKTQVTGKGIRKKDAKLWDKLTQAERRQFIEEHYSAVEPDTIEKSVNRMRELFDTIALDMKELGIINEEVKKEHYIHHQIGHYLMMDTPGNKRQSIERVKAGFSKRRLQQEEGGDFSRDPMYDPNIEFIGAQREFLTDAFRRIGAEKTIADIKTNYDSKDRLKDEAKKKNDIAYRGGIKKHKEFERLKQAHKVLKAKQNEAKGNSKREKADKKPAFTKKDKAAMKALYEAMLIIDPRIKQEALMAQGFSAIEDAFSKGEIDLSENPHFAKMLKSMTAETIYDDNMWPVLSWLARGTDPDAYTEKVSEKALSIFSAIREKEKMTKGKLGRKFSTWTSLAKADPTLTLWQPEQGNVFYRAFTIPDKLIEQGQKILAEHIENDPAMMTAFGVLGHDAMESAKQIIALGGPKEQFAIPAELATQLDTLQIIEKTNFIAKGLQKTTGYWKKWILNNPFTTIPYNLRNLAGDLDVAIAGNPRVLKEVIPVLIEMWNIGVNKHKKSADYMEAESIGVFSSSNVYADLYDVAKAGQYREFFKYAKSRKWNIKTATGHVLDMYQDLIIDKMTGGREGILRYAAYKSYKKQLQEQAEFAKAKKKGIVLKDKNGKPRKESQISYGASKRSDVEAIQRAFSENGKNPERGLSHAAGHLARNLLGDYSNVTVAGDILRTNLAPFWAFTELNFRRYQRIVRNATTEGRLHQIVTQAATKASLKMYLRVYAINMVMTAWNHMAFPEEEEALSDWDKNNPHVLFYSFEDGSVQILRGSSAVGELLSWVGGYDLLDDLFTGFASVRNGQEGFDDILSDVGSSAWKKLIGSAGPVSKGTFEVVTGQSLFPDPSNPREKDSDEVFAANVGLESEYRAAKEMVLKRGDSTPGHLIAKSVTGITNSKQNAINSTYNIIKLYSDKVGADLDSSGHGQSKSRFLKSSLKNNNKEAFEKALYNHLEAGKGFESFVETMDSLDPINTIPKNSGHREALAEFMTDEQHETVEIARLSDQELREKAYVWYADAVEKMPVEKRNQYTEQRAKKVVSIASGLNAGRPKLTDFEKYVAWEKDQKATLKELQEMNVTSTEFANSVAYMNLTKSRGQNKTSKSLTKNVTKILQRDELNRVKPVKK